MMCLAWRPRYPCYGEAIRPAAADSSKWWWVAAALLAGLLLAKRKD